MIALEADMDGVVERIWQAQRGGRPVPLASQAEAGLDLDRAYEIQRRVIERWIDTGETARGWKIGMAGATERAAGAPGPIYGRLLAGMMSDPDAGIEVTSLAAPMAEVEIAFVMAQDLSGPGVRAGDVIAASAGVAPAVEVFDGRLEPGGCREPVIEDWVADNAASARAAVGEVRPLGDVDLRLAGMAMWVGGELVRTGAGAHVLGNPANAVAWLANALAATGGSLAAGEVVLSGSLAAPLKVAPGDRLEAEISQFGSIEVSFS